MKSFNCKTILLTVTFAIIIVEYKCFVTVSCVTYKVEIATDFWIAFRCYNLEHFSLD